MILLHRPWAKYGSISGDSSSTGSHPSPESDRKANSESPGHHITAEGSSMSTDDRQRVVHGSRTSLARSICTQQAIRVARIFWQHRQRFDGRKIFITGMQHAGTASIALIAALAYQRNEPNRQTYIGYLEILSDAVGDMSATYHPASRMDDLLKAVLDQIRSSMTDVSRSRSGSAGQQAISIGASSARSGVSYDGNTSVPVVPVRREADTDFNQPLKKRRPSVHRQTSDYASSKPSYLGITSQPAPPLSLPYGQQSQSPLDPTMFPMNLHSQPEQLGLTLVGTNAVNMHHPDLATGHMVGTLNAANLGNPLHDNWGLPNMQPSFPQGQFHGAIDWSAGTAGLSASSVLNQSAAMSTGIMSGIAAFSSAKEPPKFGGSEGGMHESSSSKLPHIVTNWTSTNVGPVGSGRMQEYGPNLGKTTRLNDVNNDEQRNYSLDFFNFG